MKYTTTAEFGLVGTMGSLKSGVLNKVTGQLGSTVNKAKNWLQKAGQAKQEIGSASIAKQRLQPKPYVSPNVQAEAIARRKYGESQTLKAAQAKAASQRTARETLASKKTAAINTANTTASQSLNANTRNNNYQYAKNAQSQGVLQRQSEGKLTDSLSNQQSLRLRYTKDPRTGKLVSAAYSASISLLCDL